MPKQRNSPGIRTIGGQGIRRGYVFHGLLELGFGSFLLVSFAAFLVYNTVFAFFYHASGGLQYSFQPEKAVRFLESLYFSLTFPVVGFGGLIPLGWGRLISAIHIFIGLVYLSCLTGLIFTRFSKTRSPLVWSSPVVLEKTGKKRYLRVRVTNVIGNDVVNVTAHLYLQKTRTGADGNTVRSLIPVPLEIATIPVAAFSWILSHPVGPGSPLTGWVRGLETPDERLIGFLHGFDATLGKEIYSYCKWSALDLVRGSFVSVIRDYSEDPQLRVKVAIDLTKIDAVKPAVSPGPES